MGKAQVSLTVILSILATGAALNLASQGTFGDSVKKVADYITKGFGV